MSQYIVHSYKNLSPLFDDIENLYTITSESSTRLFEYPISDACKNIVDVFNGYYPEDALSTVPREYKKLRLPEFDKRNLILCFSGGKDSVAAALHYKKNYNVYLYHMQGINKVYVDEYLQAENLAFELGLPIFIDKVSLKGNQRFTEHFMKNMLIANGALHFGINYRISTKIAFGNYYTSVLADNAFDVCAGDCKDMWVTYESAIRKIIPKFRIYLALKNIQTSYKALLQKPELLEHIISCIGPYRYRQYWKNGVESKYGLRLLPNRCGRCWKCCLEYIYYTDYDIFEFNEEYYKYCLEVLKKTYYHENGVKLSSLMDVWYRYCFYDIKKSKYFRRT